MDKGSKTVGTQVNSTETPGAKGGKSGTNAGSPQPIAGKVPGAGDKSGKK